MHHLAIAGFLSALVVAHAAVAVYCVLVYFGRPRENEFLLFGLLNFALVAFDLGYAESYASTSGLTAGLLVAEGGRIFATFVLVHYVLVYTRRDPPRVALAAMYGVGVAFEVLNALGHLQRMEEARLQAVQIFGLRLEDVSFPPTAASVVFAAARVAAVSIACVELGRSFLRGRREGLAFVGVTVLAVTVAHDALRTVGWAFGPSLGPYGYASFVLGVMMTLLSRYGSLRRQLESRASELKKRSRELSKSYDQLRTAQDELVRKEQLAAIGELSAVIAHEVRNPLAIITNAVATLRRPGIQANDRDTLLSILDEESSRLNRLVGDLLVYAKPVNIERQLLSLREIVDRGMALTESREDLTKEFVIGDGVERIWGDPNLLRQVVDNLINNAVQAMSGGGILTITLAAKEQDGTKGVELQIQDTGEGMDTQVRNRALDPFFTTRPSGTGLGLAIVARIVDAHGGKLLIKSAAGAGTIVHVFLPKDGEARSKRSDRPDRPSSLPPMPVEVKKAMMG